VRRFKLGRCGALTPTAALSWLMCLNFAPLQYTQEGFLWADNVHTRLLVGVPSFPITSFHAVRPSLPVHISLLSPHLNATFTNPAS
jgi:hypothetical protein